MQQRPEFNVISEPWIPVETKEGQFDTLGIRETLLRAHELRSVCAMSPLFTYGIQRILIAFLIDAFRPEEVDDLAELIGKGRFDEHTIDSYIDLCRQDGECFDLFNEKKPFLQTPFDNKDNQPELIVKLFTEWPEGNNHVHFNHAKEDSHLFTPAQCVQALCALPAFALNFGRATYFGINGQPPVYLLYAGNTLFGTLACSMIAKSEYSSNTFDEPPAAWRSNTIVRSGEPLARVSLLHGLTCQSRRIQMLPERKDEEIIIKYIFYDKGWDYKTVSNWRDPHVAYYLDDKGVQKVLRPNEGRAIWRDLGRILPKGTRPAILNNIEEKLLYLDNSSCFAALNTYSLTGKFKGAIYAAMSWFEEPVPNHLYLLKDEDKTKLLLDCIQLIEILNRLIARTLQQSLRQLLGEGSSKKSCGRYAQLIEQAQTLFLEKCHEYVIGELTQRLQQTDTQIDWEIPIKIETGKTLKRFTLETFNNICDKLGNSAKTLEWRAVAENVLRGRINACMKGGWKDEREATETGTKKG